MAQPALARGGTTRTRTPDILSARTHAIGRWAVPAVVGVVYGYWAAANRRHGGPITVGNFLFGLVTGIVLMLLMTGVLYLAPHLSRVPHAMVWGALAGAAVGFLYAQTGGAVGAGIGLGLATGAGLGLCVFYWVYTHQTPHG
ncbi:hypothetical protein [Streptomyces sp. NPDC003697]